MNCSPVSGSTFAIGQTTVNCSSSDLVGNTAIGSFTVTVQDTTAPVLTLPLDITAEATSSSGAVVSFTATALDMVDGSLTPTCDPASGSTFGLGETTVSCSSTDVAGNIGSGSFKVTVLDRTAPVVTVPASFSVEATSPAGAVVTFTVTASDIVDGSLTPTCVPASGSTLAIGETTVNCSATDAAGNIGSGSFKVTVQDTGVPTSTISFPVTGGRYNGSLWNGGCSTPGACGTKSDTGSGVKKVQISIQQVSSGQYWSGSAFDQGLEFFFDATGTTGWSSAFAFSNFTDGDYVIHALATDNTGNVETPGPTATFTIDTTVPAVTLSAPANGSSTNNPTPAFSGVGGLRRPTRPLLRLRFTAGRVLQARRSRL